jgi:hypothetical protein
MALVLVYPALGARSLHEGLGINTVPSRRRRGKITLYLHVISFLVPYFQGQRSLLPVPERTDNVIHRAHAYKATEYQLLERGRLYLHRPIAPHFPSTSSPQSNLFYLPSTDSQNIIKSLSPTPRRNSEDRELKFDSTTLQFAVLGTAFQSQPLSLGRDPVILLIRFHESDGEQLSTHHSSYNKFVIR